MAQSFHPCSTTLPRCVCPAPPPQLHPGSSQTLLTPPPPAPGCCHIFLPPEPKDRWKEIKTKHSENVTQQNLILGLSFVDRCRRVNCEASDANSMTYFRLFQSPGHQLWSSWDIRDAAANTSRPESDTSTLVLPLYTSVTSEFK